MSGNGIPAFTVGYAWKNDGYFEVKKHTAWWRKVQIGRKFMGKLSKYEKETIVNFNEGETEATSIPIM